MKITKQDEWQNKYKPSANNAKNWEVSILWSGEYSQENNKIRGNFTALNRTPKGIQADYPTITLIDGVLECFILEGEFICNNSILIKGDHILYTIGEEMRWSSVNGGEMLLILKGDLLLK